MIGVMPKMLSVSRPGSTPTIGLPVLIASTTVLRRDEISSPNDFWSVNAQNTVAGGSLNVISGMPCAFKRLHGRRRAAPPARRGRPW